MRFSSGFQPHNSQAFLACLKPRRSCHFSSISILDAPRNPPPGSLRRDSCAGSPQEALIRVQRTRSVFHPRAQPNAFRRYGALSRRNSATNCEGGARIHGDLPWRGETISQHGAQYRLSAPCKCSQSVAKEFQPGILHFVTQKVHLRDMFALNGQHGS